MFFTRRDNWKILLFIKVYSYSDVAFNRHVLAFFEATSDLKEVRIFFFFYLHDTTNTKIKVQRKHQTYNKKVSYNKRIKFT